MDPLDRIADALEDFLSITLAAQSAATILASDDDARAGVQPIVDALDRVRARREKRLEAELETKDGPDLDLYGTEGALSGAGRIAVERSRQKLPVGAGGEGYDEEHDEYEGDRLALAAASYALPASQRTLVRGAPRQWPWASEHWKPTLWDRVRELEKAGALIAAAIDEELRHRKEVSHASD